MHAPIPITRSLSLEDGQTTTLTHRRGQWLRVIEGTVWLTREGADHDVFLVAGRRCPVQAPGRVLVEGVGRARVVTERPASAVERFVFALVRLWRARGGPSRRLRVRRACLRRLPS